MNKDKSSGINWVKILDMDGARNTIGEPDVAATMRMLEEELANHISTNEIPAKDISEALDKVNEKFPASQFDLQGLAQRALQEIVSVPPGAETRAVKRIADHIRAESDMFKAGGDGKYLISLGKGARIKRITPEFAVEYRKKQEAKALA